MALPRLHFPSTAIVKTQKSGVDPRGLGPGELRANPRARLMPLQKNFLAVCNDFAINYTRRNSLVIWLWK